MEKMISIVVPCYNEKETVELFYDATVPVLKEIGYDYELIYVNDGSKDSTLDVLKKMVKEELVVKRQQGQENWKFNIIEKEAGYLIINQKNKNRNKKSKNKILW